MSARWLTAAELAGLPGIAATPSGVIRQAKREGWESRKRDKGKGLEYGLDAIPAATRQHLLRREAAALVAQPKPAPVTRTPQRVAELAGWQREVMNARLAVCASVERLMSDHEISGREAIRLLLTQPGDDTRRTLLRANARGERLPSRGSIYRWLQARSDGAAALAPQPSRAKGAQPAWLAPLLALYGRPQKPAITECLDDWSEHYPEIPAPSERSAQRHIKLLPAEVRNYGRMGKRALRSVQPFVRRTMDGLWPMDVVTVDGHLFKAYVRHPLAAGQKIRPEITNYLDIATRRAIGFSAWLAESQMAIWSALRDTVLNPEQGIPALHYSDNGAYRGEQHQAILARIGTTMMFSEAYRAQARGVVERFNSSVWVPLARKFETYVNDDSDAEAVKKALTIANGSGANLVDWMAFVDKAREAINTYNDTPHRSLGNRTPNQAWADAVAEGWRPTTLEHDDLHELLPSVTRTVNRGWVQLPWGQYFDEALAAHHGRRVVVGAHPTDGSRVWVSDADGRLICVATRDGNARPYVPESMLEHARAQREQGRLLRLERKAIEVRAERAALVDVPPAELGAEPTPIRHAATVIEPQDDQDHYDSLLRAALGPAMQRMRENSLHTPVQRDDDEALTG